jgi:hypothetical protein
VPAVEAQADICDLLIIEFRHGLPQVERDGGGKLLRLTLVTAFARGAVNTVPVRGQLTKTFIGMKGRDFNRTP